MGHLVGWVSDPTRSGRRPNLRCPDPVGSEPQPTLGTRGSGAQLQAKSSHDFEHRGEPRVALG
jgi:hypothetical protein